MTPPPTHADNVAIVAGIATAGAATTITDTTKNFGSNALDGLFIRITAGTGRGQVRKIASHTATEMTIDGGVWATNPDTTSQYVIYATTPSATMEVATDGLANPNPGPAEQSLNYGFNGSTWDRARNNTEATVLASAARTASVDSADLTNYNAKGLHVVVNVTAIVTTPSITVKIQGKDALSGKYYDILTSAAISTVSTTVLKVFPGITVAANLSVSDILPRTWRVSVTNADADEITYSVGASPVV